MQKVILVFLIFLLVPANAVAAEGSPTSDLRADLLECARYPGVKRHFCLDTVLLGLAPEQVELPVRTTRLVRTPGAWIVMNRAPETGGKAIALPFIAVFDGNSPGGQSSGWPRQPSHAFAITCIESKHEVGLLLQGLPLATIEGGNIVQFKVDKTPTQTLFLDAVMTNRFFGRMTASGEGVAKLIESIKAGKEMTVWATIRPEDEVRLTFPIAKAAENLAVVDSACGP